MYAVESKNIREQLDFRIKSLRAIGHEDIADMIVYDLGKILQNEKFILVTENSDYVEKIRFARSGQ